MYLECPNCRAVYELSENIFRMGSVEVKCLACSHIWLADGEGLETISELMGADADDAFSGLRGFLEGETSSEREARSGSSVMELGAASSGRGITRGDYILYMTCIILLALFFLGFLGFLQWREVILENFSWLSGVYDFLSDLSAILRGRV